MYLFVLNHKNRRNMSMANVFRNISAECARNGLSTEAFCQEIQVPKRTWYNWVERGDFPISVLVRAVQLFKVSADTLLGISFDN